MTYHRDAWRRSVTNGEIPRELLAEIEPRFYDSDLGGPAVMHPEVAAAMSAFIAAGKAAGHTLRPLYSYRTLAKQKEKWAAYEARGFKPPIVARPGTSNHGWAVTVDFAFAGAPAATIAWAHENCRRFGFNFDVPSENWHCTALDGLTWDYEEDEMTKEQLEKLKAADAALAGVRDFLEGRKPGPDAPISRKQMFNALTRAASQPKPGEPAPHDHDVTLQGKTSSQ